MLDKLNGNGEFGGGGDGHTPEQKAILDLGRQSVQLAKTSKEAIHMFGEHLVALASLVAEQQEQISALRHRVAQLEAAASGQGGEEPARVTQ